MQVKKRGQRTRKIWNIRKGEMEKYMKEKEVDKRETFPCKNKEIVKARQDHRKAVNHH